MTKTLELWRQARSRFESALELASEDDQRLTAQTNHRHVVEGIAELEGYEASPPPECDAPRPPDSAESTEGGASGDEESANDPDEELEDQDEPSENESDPEPVPEEGGAMLPHG